jgi:uncharacterized Rmd1/YagE family protein
MTGTQCAHPDMIWIEPQLTDLYSANNVAIQQILKTGAQAMAANS